MAPCAIQFALSDLEVLGARWYPRGMGLDPRPDHRPTPMPLVVLHEDEASIAVAKPAGLLVIPDRFDPHRATLFNGVWHHLWDRSGGDPELCKPRLVHRLDRDTSGVVIFAKCLDAQRVLSRAFERGLARKLYLALVDGEPPEEGEVDLPLGPAPKTTRRTRGRIFVNVPGARQARTSFRLRERLPGRTLLEVEPHTGRTHQIRVHLAAIGHPLSVDPLYGARSELRLGDVTLARLSLHAERLEVEGIIVQAPCPDDLRAILEAARQESGPKAPLATGQACGRLSGHARDVSLPRRRS
jgi:23S rRNA pseudouridine1911/1915/1917 synthase